ncbi:Gamma-aminobutyric acid type B receptor subunit 2 [Trichoplax sp. H2]|nr:Gamma-aminobutyric acid type B receptor subunit 2 [Trichoplax sp. H2]|eukprot:RDD36470.1 Gamma-aminobutyric acid type B receptor subunit 2 [Trichoplax sp. H2]
MAINNINEADYVLPNYRLQVEYLDSQIYGPIATKAMIDSILRPPTKIAIVGPLISSASEYVASIAKYWNLVQIGYASLTVALDDRSIYPYYFRTAVTEKSFNAARLAFFKRFQWNKIGIVHSSSGAYPKSALLVQNEMTKANVDVAVIESITGDGSFALNSLKAYRQNYYGSKYIWWFPGLFSSNWWDESPRDHNCTAKQLFEVIKNSSFYTNAPIYSPSKTPAVSGKTGLQFYEELSKRINYTIQDSDVSSAVGAIYDSIWSIALALNQTESRLIQKNISITDFNYQNNYIRSNIFEELSNLSFQGVTGYISFLQGSSRLGDVIVLQQQGWDTRQKIGFYKIYGDELKIYNKTILWRDGKPPQDRLIITIAIKTIAIELFIVFSAISCLGILYCLALIAFTFIKRNNRFIKMASPNLNCCILIGCILCYTSVLISGMDAVIPALKDRKYSCVAEIWLLSIGFTIAFGSVMLKTWRIFKIFTNKTKIRLVIKDIHLLTRVTELLIVDIIILTLWSVIDPVSTTEIDVGTVVKNEKQIIRNRIQVCTSNYSIVWLIIILVFKSVMLMYGVSLAWRTRKVLIQTFNDSRSLAVTIYNILVLSSTGVIVGMLSNNIYNVGFALKSTFIILCTTSSVCLVFIPKLFQVKINTNRSTSLPQSNNRVSNFRISLTAGKDAHQELTKMRLIIAEVREEEDVIP